MVVVVRGKMVAISDMSYTSGPAGLPGEIKAELAGKGLEVVNVKDGQAIRRKAKHDRKAGELKTKFRSK